MCGVWSVGVGVGVCAHMHVCVFSAFYIYELILSSLRGDQYILIKIALLSNALLSNAINCLN